MRKAHVKTNDTVVVISGKSKDKQGKVLEVIAKDGLVVVEGTNIVKKHTRARPPKVPQGGIIEIERAVALCKVKLVCPKCSRPTRVTRRRTAAGTMERVCRKCNEVI